MKKGKLNLDDYMVDIETFGGCYSIIELTDEYVIISNLCRKKDCVVNEDNKEKFNLKITFDLTDPDDIQCRQILRTLVSKDKHANISVEMSLSVSADIIRQTDMTEEYQAYRDRVEPNYEEEKALIRKALASEEEE